MSMNLENAVTTIMTSELTTAGPDDKLLKLKHIYEQQEFHSHIPITEGDKLIGIVSLIDFMHAIEDATLDDGHEAYQTKFVRDIMTQNPLTVTSNTSIRETAEMLAARSFHSILVVDDGNLKGIVTTHDILKELIR